MAPEDSSLTERIPVPITLLFFGIKYASYKALRLGFCVDLLRIDTMPPVEGVDASHFIEGGLDAHPGAGNVVHGC